MTLRTTLTTAVAGAARQLLQRAGAAWPEGLEVQVTQPARLAHGDYSSSLPLQLAPLLRRAPVQIAADLAAAVQELPLVARAEAAPPGHLNLFLDWGEWAALYRAGALAAPRGDAPGAAGGQRVLVEHTSINPNKAAHVGHLRNSCIGDTLVRLFRRLGYHVEACNYVDDLGNQVADTVVGLLDVPVEGDHRRFGDFCWDVYARVNQAYGAGAISSQRRAEVQHALESGGTNLAWLGEVVAERLTREQLEDMAGFGVAFDFLVWERDVVRGGFWDAAAERLRQSPRFVKESEGRLAGCWVLKEPEGAPDPGGPAGHTAEKVLVRANGLLTYTARDIAFHLWKFGVLPVDLRFAEFLPGVWSSSPRGAARPFGRAARVLNVIDSRQEYPQQMVRLALQTLGLHQEAANLHHVRYGVVTLSPDTAARLGLDTSKGRASYPMSGRQGIGIKVSDLLEQMEAAVEAVRPRKEGIASREVAAAAIRYSLLRFNLLTEIVLDLEQAAALHGNSGVYLMYQHARCAKLLQDGGWSASPGVAAPAVPAELLDDERALLRLLSAWEDTLAQAAAELNPTPLATYAYELASTASRFYEAAPVLKRDVPAPLRDFRLWLVALTRETLADALATIGLPAPDSM
jgi:arginyl-tRNA synthetase